MEPTARDAIEALLLSPAGIFVLAVLCALCALTWIKNL